MAFTLERSRELVFRTFFSVFLDAPKWEAPAFLLEALTDPDDGVRALAVWTP